MSFKTRYLIEVSSTTAPKAPTGAPSGDVLNKENQIKQDLNSTLTQEKEQQSYSPQPNKEPDISYLSFETAQEDAGNGTGKNAVHKETINDKLLKQHKLSQFQHRVLGDYTSYR